DQRSHGGRRSRPAQPPSPAAVGGPCGGGAAGPRRRRSAAQQQGGDPQASAVDPHVGVLHRPVVGQVGDLLEVLHRGALVQFQGGGDVGGGRLGAEGAAGGGDLQPVRALQGAEEAGGREVHLLDAGREVGADEVEQQGDRTLVGA